MWRSPRCGATFGSVERFTLTSTAEIVWFSWVFVEYVELFGEKTREKKYARCRSIFAHAVPRPHRLPFGLRPPQAAPWQAAQHLARQGREADGVQRERKLGLA